MESIDVNPRRTRPRPVVLALTTATLVGAFVLGIVIGQRSGGTDRQRLVAERGAAVMHFDLDATTHRFDATETGGVQTVVADDPADATQVRRVRQHLRAEQARFRSGDFGDPVAIHGADMPGVATLEDRFDQLDVTYRNVPAGGEITYTTSVPDVVAALHDWFDAQLSDHGGHAERD